MNADLDKIAEYAGKLCGAAQRDLNEAKPEDVGLNGMPVLGWRKAYLEGCKDMANGVAAQINDGWLARFHNLFRSAFDAALKGDDGTDQQRPPETK